MDGGGGGGGGGADVGALPSAAAAAPATRTDGAAAPAQDRAHAADTSSSAVVTGGGGAASAGGGGGGPTVPAAADAAAAATGSAVTDGAATAEEAGGSATDDANVNVSTTGSAAAAAASDAPANPPTEEKEDALATPPKSNRSSSSTAAAASSSGGGGVVESQPSVETPLRTPSSPRHDQLSTPASTPSTASAQATASAMFNPPALRSVSSFKVLTECPLTIMLLFQLHPTSMKGNISTLITLMMECLGIQGPDSKEYEYRGVGGGGDGSPSSSSAVAGENVEGKMIKTTTTTTTTTKPSEEADSTIKKEGVAKTEDATSTAAVKKEENEVEGEKEVQAQPSEEAEKEGEGGEATKEGVVADQEMKDSGDGSGSGSSPAAAAGELAEGEAMGSSSPRSGAAPPAAAAPSPQVVSIIQSLALRYHARLSRDLVAAQVKTLSFLTYLLRGYANEMIPYTDRIASSVVYLMKTCPRDALSTRKELLVATRHILATEFRSGFYRRIDDLLDDRVLVGTGRPASNDILALRPLGYSTLADLVHHVRSNLSMAQVNRVVSIFGRVVHDAGGGLSLPPSREPFVDAAKAAAVTTKPVDADENAVLDVTIGGYPPRHPPIATTIIPAVPTPPLPLPVRITSVRLLLNLVDHAYQNRERDAQLGRDVLYRILDILVRKLENLKEWGVPGIFVLEEVGESAEESCKGGRSPTKSDRTATTIDKDVTGAGESILNEGSSGDKDDESGKDQDRGHSDVTGEGHKGSEDATVLTSTSSQHGKQGRRHAYLRSLASGSSNSSDGRGARDTRRGGFINPAPNQEQLYSIQSLVRPIVVGIKTLIWTINTYGSQREKARRELKLEQKGVTASTSERGDKDATDHSAGKDKSKSRKKKSKSGDSGKGPSSKGPSSKSKTSQPSAGVESSGASKMGSEDSPLAIQKLTNAERELIDRFFIASLGCLEVFRPRLGEFTMRLSKEIMGDGEALIDFGRWPSRQEVLFRHGYNTDCRANGSDTQPLLVLPLVQPCFPDVSFHCAVPGTARQYQTMLETLASTYLILDPYNLRRTIGPRLDVLFDAMVTDPVNIQAFFSHLLVGGGPSGGGGGEGDGGGEGGASGTYEFCDLLLDYLNARLSELGTDKVVPLRHFVPNEGEGGQDEGGGPSVVGMTRLLRRRKAACIIRLFELCLSSITSFPRNEETLRPKLTSIVITCLKQSMQFVDISSEIESTTKMSDNETGAAFCGYNYLYLLRMIFRTISGGKFEESYKVRVFLCYIISCVYRSVIPTFVFIL